MESILSIKNLSFGYDREKILEHANVTIEKGDFVALLGNNGSGKSTLLRLILGDLVPQEGKIILFGGRYPRGLSKVGYVPQVNMTGVPGFPITAEEMVMLNLNHRMGLFKIPRREHRKRAKEALAQVGLSELSEKKLITLSGGQQQRVMIAKALVHSPTFLIFDEPMVGIDQESRHKFLEVLGHLNREHAITILMVTHELEGLLPLVNRFVHIENKRLKEVHHDSSI